MRTSLNPSCCPIFDSCFVCVLFMTVVELKIGWQLASIGRVESGK